MSGFLLYEYNGVKFNYDTEKEHFFLQGATYPQSSFRWKTSSEVVKYIDYVHNITKQESINKTQCTCGASSQLGVCQWCHDRYEEVYIEEE